MLSLLNPNQIYQTKIEVSDFATGLEQFETIYVCLNAYPLYQIKYYEMLGFYISPEIQSSDYFSDLNKLEKASNIKSHKNLPNFEEIQIESLQTIKDLYNEKQLLNYNYIQGKLHEKENNFVKAFAAFEEGLKFKEQLSMLEIFKILIEPKLAQNFSVLIYLFFILFFSIKMYNYIFRKWGNIKNRIF